MLDTRLPRSKAILKQLVQAHHVLFRPHTNIHLLKPLFTSFPCTLQTGNSLLPRLAMQLHHPQEWIHIKQNSVTLQIITKFWEFYLSLRLCIPVKTLGPYLQIYLEESPYILAQLTLNDHTFILLYSLYFFFFFWLTLHVNLLTLVCKLYFLLH